LSEQEKVTMEAFTIIDMALKDKERMETARR
jgi:hypothetical protein